MDRYEERKPLLRKTIQQQNSHIMCLQEVSFLPPLSQIPYLITNDENQELYKIYNAELQVKFHELPPHIDTHECKLDGNTVLIQKGDFEQNFYLVEEKILHLSAFRVAHALKFEQKENKLNYFWVVNTHLHHEVPDFEIRFHQLQNIYVWLYKITDYMNDNIILCGDFNMQPSEKGYQFVKNIGFQSVYELIHKNEPRITFPTGLQAPNMDTDPEGCFDYIFIKGKNIIPKDICIFGDKCLENDNTIYPSDHMGLTSILDVVF